MNAYLLLANGMVFAGQSVGAQGVTVGEVVFSTGMVGFQETLTDPSYYGQIITQTDRKSTRLNSSHSSQSRMPSSA